MAGSFSQELEELLNPLPKFADPEDDADEATKARVIDRLSDDDEDDVGVSALRKRNSAPLVDTDRRYAGKPVSRQQLLMDVGESEEEEDDEEGDMEEDDDDVEGEETEDVGDINDDDDIDYDEEEEGEDEEDAKETSKAKDADITFPDKVDFYKMTEGMDDLGMSDEGGDDEDDSGEESEGSDGGEGSEDDETGGEQEAVRTFSRDQLDEEVEKGRAVRNQLALWDQLLEGRIRIQKALATANRLPQPPAFAEFKRRGGAEYAGALKDSRKALKALQRSLLELHERLLCQSPDTRSIAAAGEEERETSAPDAGAPKRKLEPAEYPDFMAKRFAAFLPYRDATLQKWHDKTRLTTGKSGRGFAAFDRNILSQVEQVLADRDRLLRRTQTRRSEYRVLGKRESRAAAAPEEGVHAEEDDGGGERPPTANAHLKDLDEDIFDDDDFYHQLLRELIERRTSAADPNEQVAAGRQWLAIQKLRSKIKKKVDTKASKGRKVRFHVHSKLVNFMAPVEHSGMSDEARSELYRGLFAQNAAGRE